MAQISLFRPVPSIRIDPDRLMGMLLWGILCGAALGVLWDIFRLTRVMLGVPYPSRGAKSMYERPLPFLKRPLGLRSEGRSRIRAGVRIAVIFLEDVVFGVVGAAVMILLVYVTNDGVFRVMAPAGMLIGFCLYYVTVGRLVLSLSQMIVFCLRAGMLYLVTLLLLPPRLAVRLWKRTVGAWIARVLLRCRRHREVRYHQKMLGELLRLAESGWQNGSESGFQKKGGWHYAPKRKTHQENDPGIAERSSLSDADRGFCHHLFCNQDDGEQQAQAGAGCAGGADRGGQAKSGRSAIRRRRPRGRKLRGGLGQG